MKNYELIFDDAKNALDNISKSSVHSIITSPPFFQLRDYGYSNQIGLEKTPQEYIDSLRNIFASCKNVLRDDGTLWINIGDSYSSSNGSGYKKAICWAFLGC
jgi:DNA modification methylase